MNTVNTTIAAFALIFIANELFFDDNNNGRNVERDVAPAGDMTANARSSNNSDSSDNKSARTAANVLKNPGVSVNAEDLPHTMYRRLSVTYADIEYSSAGHIYKNGDTHCSGNAVELEEYETVPENGILVSSAAHCFDNMQPDDEYNFVVDFMDENNMIHTYRYTNPQIWTNPHFKEGTDTTQPRVDQGLVFFAGQSLPDEITPARLRIYSDHIVRDFTPHYFNNIDLTAAGYSSDMFGLSRDTNCYIQTIRTAPLEPFYLETDCQIFYGGSGSGLIFENLTNEDPRQKTIGAITSSISKDIDIDSEDFFSRFSMYYHHNLAEVPFLRRKDICARVSAESGLNLRSANYKEPDSIRAGLPFNEVVYVTDMLYDEQIKYGPADVWLEVRKLDNPYTQMPDGYANSTWLEETPCPSAPAP